MGAIRGLFYGYGFLRFMQSYTEEIGFVHKLFKKYSLDKFLKDAVLIPFSIFGLFVSSHRGHFIFRSAGGHKTQSFLY